MISSPQSNRTDELSSGLIYFIVAFAANLIATVFMLVHLNQIMAIIFNVPAVVASTVSGLPS